MSTSFPACRSAPRRKTQSGFSLLEVLVAFLILSVSLGVLLQSFATGLRNTTISREYTLAALHAESLLNAFGVEEPIDQPGVDRGDIDDLYAWEIVVEDYEWPQEVTEDDDFNPIALATPYQVTVTVSWPSGEDRERAVVLQTLRLVAEDSLQ